MVDINTGLFLGGVARQQNVDRELGLRDRAVEVQETQLQFQQQTARRNEVMEAIGNTIQSTVDFIKAHPDRSSPAFKESIDRFRSSLSGIVNLPATQALGILPDSILPTFENTVIGTQTATEAAQAEATAGVAGAQATAAGLGGASDDARVAAGLATPPRSEALQAQMMETATARLAEQGFRVTTSPDGSVTVTQGGVGDFPPPARQTLTGKQLDDLRAARDIVGRGMEIATSLIESDTPFGALGSARAGAQTISGVVSDLTGIPLQDIVTEFEGLLSQLPPESREAFSVGQVDAAEGILTFAVARAIQGDSNRLLAGSINAAKAMVNLTGLTSDEQVRDKLSTVAQFLTSQDANFQRRFDQGVTGSTETGREPALSEPSGGSDTESKLIEDIDRLLGESGG